MKAMKLRTSSASLLAPVGIAGLIAAISCDSGGGPPPHTSPQSVFEAAKKACDREDWRALWNCMTPDSVEMVAAELVTLALVMTDPPVLGQDRIIVVGQKKIVVGKEKITEILAKHGVNESTKSEAERIVSQANGSMLEAGPEARKVLLEPIKDKRAFIADMMAAMHGRVTTARWKNCLTGVAKLEDLNIDRDSATGNVAVEGKSDSIAFKMIGGGWKIDFTTSFKE